MTQDAPPHEIAAVSAAMRSLHRQDSGAAMSGPHNQRQMLNVLSESSGLALDHVRQSKTMLFRGA
eukprot:8202717-Pyramimonas_sp.AAC.1